MKHKSKRDKILQKTTNNSIIIDYNGDHQDHKYKEVAKS